VNNLVVGAQMDEIVIVGVDNTPDRTNELTYSYDNSTGQKLFSFEFTDIQKCLNCRSWR
jgi:hypothetical protein